MKPIHRPTLLIFALSAMLMSCTVETKPDVAGGNDQERIKSLEQELSRMQQRLQDIESVVRIEKQNNRVVKVEVKAMRLDIAGAQQLKLTSSGRLPISANLITLNGSGSPVARVGSRVENGVVVNGSATVLVGP